MENVIPINCRHRLGMALRPLLVLLLLCIGASGYAADNKVTLDVSNVSLESVLRLIEKQTDYRFFYSKETVNVNANVSVKAQDEKVKSVLDKLLPAHGISYVINKDRIALKQAAPRTTNKKKQDSKGNKIKVVGTVTDTKGEPLIGASVKVEGEATGMATDIDGNYEIEVPEGSRLEFSYIGYKSEKKKITRAGKLDVVLAEDTQMLDEVVVIGYGTIDKKELTSAVSHVNPAAADPNSAASLQIRGVSSREAGLGPLIVLDGVPGASLTNINPNDIASFDVLKDGAASAIYGTRGSNGVIVITTKKGARDGQTHTTYSTTLSWDKANRDLDMMNADDYRSLRIPSGDAAVDLGASEDLFDLVQQVGFKQQHTLTVSGGGANTNYRVTADYRNADGIEKRGNREEYGARASINHTTKGGLFSVNLNVAPRIVYRNLADNDVFRRAIEANPTTPVWNADVPGRYYDFTRSSRWLW